jgi:uncharacterized FlaG/YvyC family protein
MGLFKKSDEEKAEKQQKIDELNQKRQADSQDKSERKAREKAAKSGFDVNDAMYVFTCLPNDDEKGTLQFPFGAVFTDRVVKFQKRWTGNVIEEISMKSVTSVEITKGLLPTVIIYASGNNITFKVGVEAEKIASTIRGLLPKAAGGAAVNDPVTQVEKLAQLLEKGLLTKEEFEKKKRELLGL